MFLMALWVVVFTICFAVISAPILIWLSASDTRHRVQFSLLLAPAFGMSLYIGVAVWLHYFGVTGRTAFILVLLVALAGAAIVLRSASIVRPTLPFAIASIVIGALIAALLNGLDYGGLSLFNYFPLTNDDTFTYLGHIDQIRGVGWYKPQFIYPAGYIANYIEVTKQRFPDAMLIADLADTFGLQTHVAFFLVQRLAVIAIGLAAAGLAGWLTNSRSAAILCFCIAISGNFLLHQCLQQFASSLLGSVIVLPLLWLVAWTLPGLAQPLHRFIGTSFAAALLGVMALASPEGHTFYLTMLGLIFLVVMAFERQWTLFVVVPPAAIIYALVSLPLLFELWTFLFSQISGRSGSGPGDWVAAPAILVQYSGIRFVGDVNLWTYPNLVLAASMAFAAASFAALAFLVTAAWTASRRGEPSELICIAVPGLIFFVAQIGLYATGRGYILLKAIDYATPLLPVLVAVAASMALNKYAWRRRELLAIVAVAVIWFPVAVSEKIKIFRTYRTAIAAMPKPENYAIATLKPQSSAVIYPDLEREVLNLFLYVNRFGSDRFALPSAVSNRFQLLNHESQGPELVAKIARLGVAGLPIADITDKELDPNIEGLQLLPAAGQVMIQRGGGWLDPEGPSVSALFRWLGGFGSFVIVSSDRGQRRELTIDFGPGPDLRAANGVEIAFGDKVLATLPAIQKRTMVRVPLPEIAGPPVTGTIRITGPQAGPRQISVVSIGTALLDVAR